MNEIPDSMHEHSASSALRCVIVVPCFNEEARLQVAAFERFFSNHNYREIGFLFVNDGSRDGTLAVLEGMRAKDPERVRLLDQKVNAGKAEAVRHGLLHVLSMEGVTVTGFWDADLATPLHEIPEFLDLLTYNDSLEMIFGSRVRLLGRNIQRRALRHYLGRCFASAASIVLRLPIYDTQCGAKLFRVTPMLKKVLQTKFHSRWIFDVELIARLIAEMKGDRRALAMKMYEFSLNEWVDVKGSKVGPMDFFRAFGELAWIYFAYLRAA